MTPLHEVKDPLIRFIRFIVERETIRKKRAAGEPWPWTDDSILQTYRFTNIHREDDKVSKHYQRSVRDCYEENSLVFPATIAYRWFNRETTCDVLFNEPTLNNITRFEEYIAKNDVNILLDVVASIPPPHVTGAFIITGKVGYLKGEGVCHYIHQWCQKPWKAKWKEWMYGPPSLEEMDLWINSEGLGSFMRGQIVADLKYLPIFKGAMDWWTWAAPGPGSQRGLNIVLGRMINATWNKHEWLDSLNYLSTIVTPELELQGIDRLHCQDLQNCLCEFSKYSKVLAGVGRPRQVFKH